MLFSFHVFQNSLALTVLCYNGSTHILLIEHSTSRWMGLFLIITFCRLVFLKEHQKSKNSQKKKNKWFDKSCFKLKKEELHFGKLTSKFPSDPIFRGTFFVIKTAFKKLVKTKKKTFKEFLLQKFSSFESDSPKDFWETVCKRIKTKISKPNISDKLVADEWLTYFRRLSTPNNSSKSGFEKLVDFIVSKLAEFAKLNEPIRDEPITLEKMRTLKSIDQVKNWQGSQKWY